MKQTENYNLNLPEQDDFYNVDDFNENAQKIDEAMKSVTDSATETSENLKEYVDSLGLSVVSGMLCVTYEKED